MQSSGENWNTLIRSIATFEHDPKALKFDSLELGDDGDWNRSAYRLLAGIVRNHTLLVHSLNQFAAKPPKGTLRGYLLLGIYQLFEAREEVSRLPKIVHHTVGLVRKECSAREANFANAVLRKISGSVHNLLDELEKKQRWNILYSHPQWLIERWREAFGEADTLALLKWNQQVPQLYVHDVTGYLETEAGRSAVEEHGLQSTSWPGFYKVPKGGIRRLLELPLYVQDPSTAIAPNLLADSLRGDILDACAAPGGKALELHKLLGSAEGIIHATDRDAGRVQMIKKNIHRLNADRIRTYICDWETDIRPEELPAQFDCALVDAPCSSVGIIQKHPEIRWRLKPSDYEILPRQQLHILEAVSQAVKPGGKLVYSTCSIDPAENTEVIKAFLATDSGKLYRLMKEISCLPHHTGHDGVGAALLQRS